MNQPNHHEHPELWFRPSPILPLTALSKLIETKCMTATPRLGKRDGMHPKGYVPGALATLRLYDEERQERLSALVRIKKVLSKPLRELGIAELKNVAYYSAGLQSVQQDLSFFEGRPVEPDDIVSLVEFAYLNNHKE